MAQHLAREIQKHHGSSGHDSVEDARACLDLVKKKCQHGVHWGRGSSSRESIFARLGRSPRPGESTEESGQVEVVKTPRRGAIVDWSRQRPPDGAKADVRISCDDDEQVLAGIERLLRADNESKMTTTDGEHNDNEEESSDQNGREQADEASKVDDAHKDDVDFIWANFLELGNARGWSKSQIPSPNAANGGNMPQESTATADDEDSLAEQEQDIINTSNIASAVTTTVERITRVFDALPPKAVLIVYSGGGEPHELARLHAMHTQFRREYTVKKWDQLSVQWTDVEEQQLKEACRHTRMGIGFVSVK